MKKNEFRYKELAYKNNANKVIDLLSSQLGMKKIRAEGNDLVIPVNSIVSKSLLSVSHRIKLSNGHNKATNAIYNSVSKELRDVLDRMIIDKQYPLMLDPSFGKLSKIYELRNKLFGNCSPHHKKIIKDEIIPFMVNEMESKYITLVTVDYTSLSRSIRIPRVLFLLQHHNHNFEKVKQSLEKNILDKILLSPEDILTLVNSLTSSSPISFTLPIQYNISSSAHFYAEAMYQYTSSIYTSSFSEQFHSYISPHSSDNGPKTAFKSIKVGDANFISLYLQSLGSSINETLNYVTNPSNFLDKNNYVDLKKQIQTIISLKLIFSDLAQISISCDQYRTNIFCSSLFDKIANLLYMNEKKFNEKKFFSKILSNEYRNHLESCIKNKLFTKVSTEIIRLLNLAFKEAVDDFKSKLNADTPEKIYEIFRLLRNTKHGAFLDKNKDVEQVFFNYDCTIPRSIVVITFMTVLALVLDFEKFLTLKKTLSQEDKS